MASEVSLPRTAQPGLPWARPPAEGDSVDFDDLVSQLLELVLALVGNQRYQGMLRASMQQLLHLTLGYMQMTAAQVGGAAGASPARGPSRGQALPSSGGQQCHAAGADYGLMAGHAQARRQRARRPHCMRRRRSPATAMRAV